jgi:hypothetical protein
MAGVTNLFPDRAPKDASIPSTGMTVEGIIAPLKSARKTRTTVLITQHIAATRFCLLIFQFYQTLHLLFYFDIYVKGPASSP